MRLAGRGEELRHLATLPYVLQIQREPEKSHRAAADRCAACSPGTAEAPAPELPSPALGPGVRELGAQPAPQQLDLPTCFPASTQPPSPILMAGERAEQSQGPAKPGTPHAQLLVALGEGQKTSCTLTPWPLPSALHHHAAWHQQPHRTDGTQTMQLLLRALPAFWSAQTGWGEFC